MGVSYLSSWNKIIGEIIDKKLAIFCGAGVSFNSGLPIVNQLLAYLYETLELNRVEIDKLFKSDIPFERIMETLLIESEIDEIKEIFTNGTPNSNHYVIAKLAKKNWLKIVYTTNFDLLIEKALEVEGLLEGLHFKVYRTEVELRTIDWDEDVIKIIKIHGCASQIQEMAVTLGQLASNRYLHLREHLLTQIFSGQQSKSVLIMGYSCSDFDLVPIINTLKNKSSKIYFIDHSSIEESIEAISLKDIKNPFKQYDGLRYYGDTSKIVGSICQQLDLDISRGLDSCTDKNCEAWTDNLDNWYNKNIEISGEAFAHHVAGKIMYCIGAFQDVITHMQKAIKTNYSQGNWIAYASNLDTMGMALNKLGKYSDAIRCYETAIPIQRQLNDDDNLASMLQSCANVLHHLKRDNEALIFFDEALKIAIKCGKKSLESNVLGNMSNSYIAISQFLKAKHSLTKAMEISRYLGNKQAESSQLGILASLHLFSGHASKAVQPLLEAIEIKKTIADYDGLCNLHLNLTTVYHLTNHYILSKEIAKKGLELALKINNQQRINEFQQAIIIYNLTD